MAEGGRLRVEGRRLQRGDEGRAAAMMMMMMTVMVTVTAFSGVTPLRGQGRESRHTRSSNSSRMCQPVGDGS